MSDEELAQLLYREFVTRGINIGDIVDGMPAKKFIISEEVLYEVIYAMIEILRFSQRG